MQIYFTEFLNINMLLKLLFTCDIPLFTQYAGARSDLSCRHNSGDVIMNLTVLKYKIELSIVSLTSPICCTKVYK